MPQKEGKFNSKHSSGLSKQNKNKTQKELFSSNLTMSQNKVKKYFYKHTKIETLTR